MKLNLDYNYCGHAATSTVDSLGSLMPSEMNAARKPLFQFDLKNLFVLITLTGALLAAFRWLPAEIRFYVFVPLAISAAIVLTTFALATLLWLLMEGLRRITRWFEDQ